MSSKYMFVMNMTIHLFCNINCKISKYNIYKHVYVYIYMHKHFNLLKYMKINCSSKISYNIKVNIGKRVFDEKYETGII